MIKTCVFCGKEYEALESNRFRQKYCSRKCLIQKLRPRNLYNCNKKKRDKILDILGRKCVICGYFKDERALNIDHINGGGCEERRNFNGDYNRYYKYVYSELISGSGKEHYQVLCANCNTIKKYEKNENRGVD